MGIRMNRLSSSMHWDRGFPRGRILNKLRRWSYLISQGRSREVYQSIRNMCWSESSALGLRRDLTQSFDAPRAAFALTVRPLQQEDLARLFDTHFGGVKTEGVLDRMQRIALLNAGVATCFVAASPQGEPCYMQWLIGRSENDKMQALFRGRFPILKDNEALLEGAFTVEKFRGMGIMAAAMSCIAEKATDIGARNVITFVSDDNVPSLKGCKRAGFYPYVVRKALWKFFRTRTVFAELPPGTPYAFEEKEKPSRPQISP